MKLISVLFLSFFICSFQLTFAQDSSEAINPKLYYQNDHPYETITVKPITGKKVKNVILMIGDGMGLDQVSAAWIANHGKLNLDNFKHISLSRTTAANRLITDSGASGTAMATGQKTNYHAVGVDADGNELNSIVDLAIAKKLSTAVVVTCGMTDATPATFCANNVDRDDEEELAADYLNCGVDYLVGGGRAKFIHRKDGRNLMEEMVKAGYQAPSSWKELQPIEQGKVFALLEDGQLPLYPERGEVFKDACLKGLSLLSKNRNGFFAMFEGSRIDDCGHWNDLPKLINEMADFDRTIGSVLQWAEKDGETLVIILADHETGGLSILDGDVSTGTVQVNYGTGGHSGILVPVYTYGPRASLFDGIYENTTIFEKIVEVLHLEN